MSSLKKGDRVEVIRGRLQGAESYFVRMHEHVENMCWIEAILYDASMRRKAAKFVIGIETIQRKEAKA